MHRAQRQRRRRHTPGLRLLVTFIVVVPVLSAGCLEKASVQRFDPATDAQANGATGPDALNITIDNAGNHSLDVTWILTHPSGHIVAARQATIPIGDDYRADRALDPGRKYHLVVEVVIHDYEASGVLGTEKDLWGDGCPSDQVVYRLVVDSDEGLPSELRGTTRYGYCV